MIAVVVPTFNEESQLPPTLAALRASAELHEVIVVDAGSTDKTRAVARSFGARIVESSRLQRAAQMNAGAGESCGDILLFLHADTRLAPTALTNLHRALQSPSVLGGGFARRYDSPSAVLRCTCILAEWRTRWSGWFLGDQAMFVRRSAFEMLGGFRTWDAFEDLDFSRRLARTGRVVTLIPPVLSHARRFAARGAWRTTFRDLLLTARYLRQPEHRLPTCSAPGQNASAVKAHSQADGALSASVESLCHKAGAAPQ